MLTVDRVLLLLAPRSPEAEGLAAQALEPEAKRALADAVEASEEPQKVRETMGGGLVERLMQRLVQKLQVTVANVHVRIQAAPETGSINGGILLREVRVGDLPPEAFAEAFTADLGPTSSSVSSWAQQQKKRKQSKLLALLSRKQVTISGLGAYLDITAATAARQAPLVAAAAEVAAEVAAAEAATAAAAEADAAAEAEAEAAGSEAEGAAGCSKSDGGAWQRCERAMVDMISAPPGPGSILNPTDLVVGAVFDPTGNLLPASLEVPRFRLAVDLPHEISLSISAAQMDLLKLLGAHLATREKRVKYRACGRPSTPPLPSDGPGYGAQLSSDGAAEEVRTEAYRVQGAGCTAQGAGEEEEPRTAAQHAAARAWWRYAVRAVLVDWREEAGRVDWERVDAERREASARERRRRSYVEAVGREQQQQQHQQRAWQQPSRQQQQQRRPSGQQAAGSEQQAAGTHGVSAGRGDAARSLFTAERSLFTVGESSDGGSGGRRSSTTPSNPQPTMEAMEAMEAMDVQELDAQGTGYREMDVGELDVEGLEALMDVDEIVECRRLSRLSVAEQTLASRLFAERDAATLRRLSSGGHISAHISRELPHSPRISTSTSHASSPEKASSRESPSVHTASVGVHTASAGSVGVNAPSAVRSGATGKMTGKALGELRRRLGLAMDALDEGGGPFEVGGGGASEVGGGGGGPSTEGSRTAAAAVPSSAAHASYVLLHADVKVACLSVTMCGAAAHVPVGGIADHDPPTETSTGRRGAQPLARVKLLGIHTSLDFRPANGSILLDVGVNDLELYDMATACGEVFNCIGNG